MSGLAQTALVAARDRRRLSEIAAVLGRHGLGDVLARLGVAGVASGGGGEDGATGPQRLRMALEALGPTFVKLGQILSTRADLLPPDWVAELERLQADVAPAPWEVMRPRLAAALGAPPETAFAAFDPAPLAAGSIAQVWRARLHDGADVVVKLRRPGLRPLIEADLRLLSHAAAMAEGRWPGLARYRPREILRHLGAAMADELDLANEARNCQAIAANLADMPDIVIPRIHDEWTCERLLVQDYVAGAAPGDAAALAAAGLDGATLARRGAQAFLHMALVDGMFHADPHPGNLRALPGNRVAFIDFGSVGRLGGRRRDQVLTLLAALVQGRGEGVAMLLLDWAGAPGGVDLSRLEAGCDAFVARLATPPLRLGEAIAELMALAREHDLALPPDLALLFRALATADGVMRRLDPGFDAVLAAEPVVAAELRRRHAPAVLLAQGRDMAVDLAGLAREGPSLLRLLALRLRQGRIGADIEIKGLDRLGGDVRAAAARIAVGVVVAAFALGVAPILLTRGPVLFGVPLAAALALCVIISGAAWLLAPRRR